MLKVSIGSLLSLRVYRRSLEQGEFMRKKQLVEYLRRCIEKIKSISDDERALPNGGDPPVYVDLLKPYLPPERIYPPVGGDLFKDEELYPSEGLLIYGDNDLVLALWETLLRET